MASVTTQKRIDLYVLDLALGGHGLSADGNLDTTQNKTIMTGPGSPVTQGQLQAAVDAHVYVAPTTLVDRLAALETVIPSIPPLGTAATRNVGTIAGTVAAGDDTRLTDARTPTTHTHPVAQVTGLHAVATTGAYSDLSGKPALSFDPAGSAAAAQAAAVQRANHTGSQPAASITGLHAVATSGDYNALANRPTIPAAVAARRVIVNTGALTANTVKNVPVTWPTAMPDTAYAVTALIESITPQNVAIGVNPGSKTTAGCTLSVRSTVAVAAAGLNVHVIGLA